MKNYQKTVFIIIFLISRIVSSELKAQSTLEVFTNESTNSFIVFINGKQINATPLTNVQVDNIEGRKITLKIVFNDKDIPTIVEEVRTRIGEYWGAGDELVKTSQIRYEIKKNKKNEFILNKPTYTYTYEDPVSNITYDNGNNNNQNEPSSSNNSNQPVMMNEKNFQQTYKLIKDAFPDKLQVAKNSLKGSWFSSQQILAIVKLLSFSDEKLDFAKSAYHRTVDKNAFEMVVKELGLFDQEKLRDYISKQ